jgi:hypothetical protein
MYLDKHVLTRFWCSAHVLLSFQLIDAFIIHLHGTDHIQEHVLHVGFVIIFFVTDIPYYTSLNCLFTCNVRFLKIDRIVLLNNQDDI